MGKPGYYRKIGGKKYGITTRHFNKGDAKNYAEMMREKGYSVRMIKFSDGYHLAVSTDRRKK